MRIRDVATGDLDRVLEINNAAVPNMNQLERGALLWFLESAVYFRVAEEEGKLAAFLIALDENAPYDSLNFRWFRERYRNFLYIDRVAVDAPFQRRGFGRTLYDDFFSFCSSRPSLERICAEVNLQPPNPGSIAFHLARGFVQVGELMHAEEKKVAMFVRELE